MAKNVATADLFVNTRQLTLEAKAAAAALNGLDTVLSSVAQGVKDAFSVAGFENYKQTVTRFGEDLANALLTLQLSFGRLKYAIVDAVAPIATVFIPMLNAAIQAVIQFSGVVGQFLRGIIAGVTGGGVKG